MAIHWNDRFLRTDDRGQSGINARPLDFAKLGSLYLHDGAWNDRRVVSAGWVHDATRPWPDPPGYYIDQGFFGPGGHYFGYFWWGDTRSGGPSDFHTVGNKGQFIYCSPQKHLVIVRTGMEYGISSVTWLRLSRQLADQFLVVRAKRVAVDRAYCTQCRYRERLKVRT
jgi:CubicO group peptidase (beta-lactamase class C family)